MVERWILSIIQTENPTKITGEGLTKIENVNCSLKEIADSCPEMVFGKYLKAWPLIKILDIGGKSILLACLLLIYLRTKGRNIIWDN